MAKKNLQSRDTDLIRPIDLTDETNSNFKFFAFKIKINNKYTLILEDFVYIYKKKYF
jgi:hypothetical protein